MSEHWAKKQLVEAHKLLTEIGVPDREVRPAWDYGKNKIRDMEISLGVPERIRWLRQNWQAK